MRSLGFLAADINAAAMAELNPPLPFQFAIASADGVGMNAETPRQVSRAGQALPWSQIVAEDTQDDLSDQLFADGNVAAARKPELHTITMLSAEECDGQTPEAELSALFLLLVLHVVLDIDEGLAVFLGAGIDGVDGVGEDEFVLLGLGGVGVG